MLNRPSTESCDNWIGLNGTLPGLDRLCRIWLPEGRLVMLTADLSGGQEGAGAGVVGEVELPLEPGMEVSVRAMCRLLKL
jgi:hypothetical protein